jgi:uncharacterized protein (TIGR02594 family)
MQPELTRRIQLALREAGYDPGPIDGVPGLRTLQAVAAALKHLMPRAVLTEALVSSVVLEARLWHDEPLWLQIARGELGVQEIPGAEHHPRILAYHKATLLCAARDEVPWCSAFACWCLEQAGVQSTRSAAARSWLTWGQTLTEPRLGAIAVIARGQQHWQGHVGFLLALEKGPAGIKSVTLLGGNQGNQVSIAEFEPARLIGLRWPLQSP